MREIRTDIEAWLEAGSAVALAQVVKTWGSSPRVPGSVMAVSESAAIAGSVSGGCIEGAIVQSALDCLEDGKARLEQFHASTLRAREVGLSCGGNIDVLVSPLDPVIFACENALIAADAEYVRVTVQETSAECAAGEMFLMVREDKHASACQRNVEGAVVRKERGCAWSVVTSHAAVFPEGAMGTVAESIASLPVTKSTGALMYEGTAYFYARILPKPQLICIGGVHTAIHLTNMAKMLGFRTVVIDPRSVFSSEERFPFVDELLHEWPQEAFSHLEITSSTALCALTHDPKIDVPALAAALDSPAFYIGSLGRSTTQLSRAKQLRDLGYNDAAIARIFGPIGLDLRGREPAEIALSIMAEITGVRHGSTYAMSSMLDSARAAQVQSKLVS